MKFLEIIFELFVLYLLYKLVFDFIIPVYQTTKQVKQKMGEMHQKMTEHMKQQPGHTAPPGNDQSPKSNKEDYIEFEEVK